MNDDYMDDNDDNGGLDSYSATMFFCHSYLLFWFKPFSCECSFGNFFVQTCADCLRSF